MTEFLDGPAVGVTLSLQRAPALMRVVQNSTGEWDALDLLEDTPALDETVMVYQRVGNPARGFICGSFSGRRGSERFTIARYKLHPMQPPREVVRNNAAWQAWAKERAAHVAA